MVHLNDRKKLFVGGISRETSEDTLKDHFAKYGTVAETIVNRDKYTRTHRGFGFVSFCDSSSFQKALQDTHVILERTVEVKPAMPRQNQQQHWNSGSNGRGTNAFSTRKIFVGGLAHSLTGEDFKSYFEKFGRITDAVVMYDKNTGRPRGFGFITFDSEDAVENVLQKSFHELGGKLVEVKRSEPREGNNNGDTRCVVKEGNGRHNFNNYQCYQCGNYRPYSSSYGVFPVYGPISGYGGAAGYPYAANYYVGGFPAGGYSGFDYGMAPLAPKSSWNSPAVIGVRGGLMPYGNVASIYPAYVSGVGVSGMAANGYNGTVEVIENGESSPLGSNNTQKGTNLAHTQVNGGSVDENSGGGVENYAATSVGENGESSCLGSNEAQKLADVKHAQVNGETVNANSGGMDGSCGATSLGENGKSSQLGTNDGQKLADVKHARVMGGSVNEDSDGMEGSDGATSSDVQKAEDVEELLMLMEKSI